MQRLLNLNSDSRFSSNQMRIRIAIATPTPTSLNKWHKVVLITNLETTWFPVNEPTLKACYQFDGVYDANSQLTNVHLRLNLLKFMQIAKDQYQLSDDDALELLAFFKTNISEACYHLDGNNANGNLPLRLEIDKPWRLQSKPICKLPGVELLSDVTYLTMGGDVFLTQPNLLLNVLPRVPIVRSFSGRRDDRDICQFWTQLMHHLQLYMAPLVLASRPWPKNKSDDAWMLGLLQTDPSYI
ncbi:uncharacterized protein LOC127565137 [Drosophila albomicans]|uniref:Uncharacterized protein LOC127565137 n=1 Tax=Drosophila albomicans TaxID=7291 RepID=A0A9C6WCN0_DROAB|nr:uncharacterized protein LOC127565137 [Drosophila albomicans]